MALMIVETMGQGAGELVKGGEGFVCQSLAT